MPAPAALQFVDDLALEAVDDRIHEFAQPARIAQQCRRGVGFLARRTCPARSRHDAEPGLLGRWHLDSSGLIVGHGGCHSIGLEEVGGGLYERSLQRPARAGDQ
jgi:hypothetical protein